MATITIDGIIDGISSPYGEGATYNYDPDGISHLDTTDKERLKADLEQLVTKAKKDERRMIIKKYGHFNDGCGCCMEETLKEALKRK